MRVKVYRNLHKKCWSIMDPKTRRVIRHDTNVVLANVSLVVSNAGRERVLREKAKNVHAYAIGEIGDSKVSHGDTVEVTYNPYRANYFFEKSSEKPRQSAAFAVLNENGRLFLSFE